MRIKKNLSSGWMLLLFCLLCFTGRPVAAAGAQPLAASPPTTTTKAEATQVERFAVVVGANLGGKGRAVLRYASKDAIELQEVLARLGGVQTSQLKTLQQPTPEQLRQALAEVSSQVAAQRAQAGTRQKRYEFLFYYSGHSDEQGLLVGEQKVPYKELKSWIAKVPSDIHVAILDSCASGAFTRLKGGSHRKPFLFANSGNVEGHAFIASSSADEASQESDAIGGSFFTHFLVTGMQGAADVDGDRLVTINEAFLFARNETLARTQSTQAGAQHPAYELKLAGTGDLVLTDLRQSRSKLELGPKLQGRVFVRDRQGRLVAELSKLKGKVTLALVPGAYAVAVVDDTQLLEAQVQLGERGAVTLSSGDFVKKDKEKGSVTRGSAPGQSASPAKPKAPRYLPGHVALIPGIEVPEFSPEQERAAQFALGVVSTRLDYVKGAVVGLGVSTVRRELAGWQGSLFANFSRGTARGVQSGVAFNTAEQLRGAQFVGGVNRVRDLRGASLAGVANAAVGRVRGAQLAGVLNYAPEIKGVQIGLLNIAGKVRGAQIGLINIASEADVSLGLIPYTKRGIHAELYTSDLALINVALRFEARYNYTFVTLGVHPFARGQVVMAGVGTGVRVPVGSIFSISPDLALRFAIGGPLSTGRDLEAQMMTIGSLRLLLNAKFHHRFTVFGGPAVHLRYAAHSQFDPKIGRPGWPLPSVRVHKGEQFRGWFGFAAGLRF